MGGMETRYEGPVQVRVAHPGGRPVRIVCPADPDRLLEDPCVLEINRRDDYMPYWAYLWPGAFLLAEALAIHEGAWPGLEALELGCGLGLAGLTALARGLRVRFTDYDAAPLRFVARSAAENAFPASRFSTGILDWTEPPEEQYPLILGADVLYERRLVPLVVGVIARMLAPGGGAWLAGPYRVATEDLYIWLDRHGLQAESLALEARDLDGRRVCGTVHRVARRHRRGG
jgi:predicted nicotinamide N-methyase